MSLSSYIVWLQKDYFYVFHGVVFLGFDIRGH